MLYFSTDSFSHLAVELKSFPCHSLSAYNIIWAPAFYDYHGYTMMIGIVACFILSLFSIQDNDE